MKIRLAIVVHGRFFAFDLARALIEQGHEVTLFTNYPKSVAEKFGVPRHCVNSFVLHGMVSRLVHFLHHKLRFPAFEAFLHGWFSRWASRRVKQGCFDAVQCYSGVAEELFRHPNLSDTLKILVRGSAHIHTQDKLLREEASRANAPVEHPSSWMSAREEREYALSNKILVLSSFARDSFRDQGIPSGKLWVLPLAADVHRFRLTSESLDERILRIRAGTPLNVLTVGTFSLRKGAVDLVQIARNLKGTCSFRFVGAIARDAEHLLSVASGCIEFVAKQPEGSLHRQYAWADLFLFPTVEDGYAVVLAQAFAAGLPTMATTNCGAPDLLTHGQTGWILPIRKPEAFVDVLRWCDSHREELADMVRCIEGAAVERGWAEVAGDFIRLLQGEENDSHPRQVGS